MHPTEQPTDALDEATPAARPASHDTAELRTQTHDTVKDLILDERVPSTAPYRKVAGAWAKWR